MYLYYNGLWFDANEASIALERKRTYNAQYRMQVETHTWRVKGVRQAASQAALTTAINTFESYMQDGGSIGLYLDDMTTLTSHYLNNAATVGGTRVTLLSYPTGDGAQYSTFRDYEFTVEGDFAPATYNLLQPLTFVETLTFTGGGPREIWVEVANGPPQRQTVTQQTTYKATQAGSATQLGVDPNIPGPIWPDYEHIDQRSISPTIKSGAGLEWTRNWSYSFESDVPLLAVPHFIV